MSITLVPEPTVGAPYDSTDYTKQNNLIKANQIPFLSALTDWELTGAAPAIKQGVYLRHANNTYIVDTGDEAVAGTPAAGLNYIELTLSGSTITAAWVVVTTGYTYNPAYGGIYNGAGKQLIPDICYKVGALFHRGRSFGMDLLSFMTGDGSVFFSGGLETNGNDVNTDGGDLNLSGGEIDGIIAGDFEIDGTTTSGSWAVGNGASIDPIPKGTYIISYANNVNFGLQHFVSGAWRYFSIGAFGESGYGGTVISDGATVRLYRTGGNATNVYYTKF